VWPILELKHIGVQFDPRVNSFTYTFPPPYLARLHGHLVEPRSYSDGSLEGDISLYLHIPFCEMDCSFCSLHRTANHNKEYIQRYLCALMLELQSIKNYVSHQPLNSVYIGGGTPTICTAHQLNELLDAVVAAFPLQHHDVEVTVECAPSPNRGIRAWNDYARTLTERSQLPVNRFSFGIQANEPLALRRMGRSGGSSAAFALLAAMNETVEHYNVDFILNYPEGPDDNRHGPWENGFLKWLDTQQENGLRVPSLSLYQLWDVPTISIARSKGTQLINEGSLIERKFRLQEGLFTRGFFPGIVSTAVRDVKSVSRCFRHRHLTFRHIGCGSGAYSIFPSEFVQRPRDIHGYITACEDGTVQHKALTCYDLSLDEVESRRLIMGLRTFDWVSNRAGFDDQLADTGIKAEVVRRIEALANIGVITKGENCYRLHHESLLIANELSAFLHPESHRRREP
jgi:oxygen-independent coproporphyrinogen-3 oxidase